MTRTPQPATLTEALAALKSRTTTAAELLSRCETALQAHPEVGSVVRTDLVAAAEVADDLDRRRADVGALPGLAGIPITVKDSYDVAGFDSGHGLAAPQHRARQDAPAVAQLREAGAVIIGKTNVPPYLGDYQSNSEEFGHTLNPWDPRRTAGGSSGGAAAVQLGQSFLDLGSDMAGSVRLPAAWCGIAAWRPTHGLVSKQQHLPWPPGLKIVPPASTPGLMARTVADLAVPAAVLCGDAASTAGSTAGSIDRTGPIRIGIWAGHWPAVGAEVSAVINAWITRANAAGLDTVEIALVYADSEALAIYDGLIEAEIAHGRGDLHSAHPLLDLLEKQRCAVAEWERLTRDVDAVLAPVAPVVAPLLSDDAVVDRRIDIDGTPHPAAEMMEWGKVTSLAQAPSVTTPIGIGAQTGMPVGVQFIGRRHRDLELIATIAALEAQGLVGPACLENPL